MSRELAPILDCLAAGYRLELDAEGWLRNLVDTAVPALDFGLGVMGYTYDATDPKNPVIDRFLTSSRFDPAWLEAFYGAVQTSGSAWQPTGFDAWGGLTCGQATLVPGMRKFLPFFACVGGAKDTFAINALDTNGRGLFLGGAMPHTRPVSQKRGTLFMRLAAHLTSAVRLRTQRPTPEAVLSPSGKLLHAETAGAADARDELRDATLAFEQARTRRAEDDTGTRRWRPLVESRWSLLDEFDTDGRRFVVAVENQPKTPDAPRDLSEREVQVLTHAALGHTNKVIAYELGLAASTVRVLMHRAGKKLGAATRDDAIERFKAVTQAT